MNTEAEYWRLIKVAKVGGKLFYRPKIQKAKKQLDIYMRIYEREVDDDFLEVWKLIRDYAKRLEKSP